ncbi:methyl-accepting chemotaxis protein [Clostridium sp.]|uniref:methyl-accepting chemotaxis protein n=1 Tax=Clostridium sp. TaxID=1506 RepID=UPI0034646E7D
MENLKKKEINFKSIGTKLIVIFILLTVFNCIVLSGISITISKKALNSMANETLPEIAKASAGMINEKLETGKQVLKNLAMNIYISDSSKPLEERLKEIENNVEINGFMRMGIADKNGIYVATNGGQLFISDKDYYKRAMAGETVVGAPFISDYQGDNNKLIFSIATPIKDKNSGEITGALIAVRDAEDFSNILSNITIGETGEAFMVDEAGTVVAHKNSDYIGKYNAIELSKIDSKLEEFSKIVQNMIKGSLGTDTYNLNGEEKFISYSPVGNTGWSSAITIDENEVLKEVKVIRNYIIILSFICVILSIILILIQVRKIANIIKTAVEHLNIMAKGDMSKDIPNALLERKDEFGFMAKAMDRTQDSIREIVKNIKESSLTIDSYSENLASLSTEMSSSSDTVATSVQEVARGAETQATDISYIVEILNDFNGQIEQVISSIKNVEEEADKIEGLSNGSNSEMKKVMVSVENVNYSFKELSNKIHNVEDDINKIHEITDVINGIAEKTNLLALNAAIEAARAGEVGRGFAVVSDEIRKLADQSRVSAKNINNLVDSVFKETNIMVDTTSLVQKELGNQKETINVAVESFDKIIGEVSIMKPKIQNTVYVTGKIEESKNIILNKIQDSAAVSQEVSASAEEIAAISEEMNASSEEVANAAQDLTFMTKSMKEDTDRFIV